MAARRCRRAGGAGDRAGVVVTLRSCERWRLRCASTTPMTRARIIGGWRQASPAARLAIFAMVVRLQPVAACIDRHDWPAASM